MLTTNPCTATPVFRGAPAVVVSDVLMHPAFANTYAVKFIVRNLLRLWGGWWNGNAADLLPATWEAQAQEIARSTRSRPPAAIGAPAA